MSDQEQPDSRSELAFGELEFLIRNVGEELANFRKRAHSAESRLRNLGSSPGGDASAEERVSALEQENALLRERLERAGERTREMLDKIRFLRQQHVLEGEL